ncbi:hypothetical protein ERO13_D04G023600v2 [Gossypium hirsutum]|uniref:Uncharacterized protein isoform X1 n=3 Tax=Gossypium TaxID=3633 RepID=A0ABM2ZYF6_GOSHI|nr:uncharacterized protein LOC107961413 isoform X1 [Gossypium hirsutum]KAB1669120.1 hypothetical protein ES319_1Z073800v1 [Gossypium barbadense]KAG4150858.1 hypothetical protein ERO13_D04G023600v2 [Gossypium hirsutum]TYG72618.1 hypothetical protein ES288_D04G036100v1 [Gossypium darwinii]
MAKPRNLFTCCSLLMAIMFGFSSSVQLNDPDWYFWFPLYACACIVNLLNWRISAKGYIKHVAKVALCLGVLLFIKVVVEGYVRKIAGFWSLDLAERVVREKTGSLLVIFSMVLHLVCLSEAVDLKQRKTRKIVGRGVVAYAFEFNCYTGMAGLVAFSYGLPFVFFVIQKGELSC